MSDAQPNIITDLPATITIDGTEVPIRIVRFDFDTREAFARDYNRLEGIWLRRQALQRLALVKANLPTQPDQLELEPKPPAKESADERTAREARNEPKLSAHAENIALALAMRELDETPTQRAQRVELDEETDRVAARITKDTFDRFVSVDPAYELIDSAGRPVRSGLDLLRSFPSQTLYANVLTAVLVQNSLAATLKKKLVSPSGSAPSSSGRSETSPAASGAAPAPTAGSVSTSASAEPVAAMEHP